MKRFTEELIARVNRAGASGVKLLRADSGFWNTKVFELLEHAGWEYSIGVRMIKTVRAAVDQIAEDAWQTIAYPDEGEAQIAETVYGARRLIVRRTRLIGASRPSCGPTGDTSASSPTARKTSRSSRPSTAITPSSSRSSATSRTRPSRTSPPASSTPTAPGPCSPPSRTTCSLDPTPRTTRHHDPRGPHPAPPPAPDPGRLTSHARGWILHLPARWPWHGDYIAALNRIRALPAAA